MPVVALTQYVGTATRSQLLSQGFAGCVSSFAGLEDLEIESRVRGTGVRLTYHDLTLDPEQYKVWRDETPIILPTFQFRLLEFFMTHPGRVFSRRELLQNVWRDADLNEGAVTACMARLRRALSLPGKPDLIRNARHSGYALDADAAELKCAAGPKKIRPGNKSVIATSPQCHDGALVDRRPGG